MTTETGAPAAAPAAAPADDGVSELSLEDARALLDAGAVDQTFEEDDGSVVKRPTNNQQPQREQPQQEQEIPERDDADPETDPGNDKTQTDETEDDLPAIEPPRSWTKEEKEAFAKWPREAQESISRVASAREAEFRRSQNEAAEARKAMDAKLGEAEQMRKEYESRLTSLVKTLEEALQAEFGDIQTMQDVRKLQAEDPFRFQQWQIKQMELADAMAKKTEADRRAENEKLLKWQNHVNEENGKFAEKLSEADKGKLKDLLAAAPDYLMERGFTQQELAELSMGKEKLSIYDHRIQSLILDGMKYRDILAAPKAVPTRPPVSVQKPGVPRVNAADANIQALERKLAQTGSEEDGWALLQAKLSQNRRSA